MPETRSRSRSRSRITEKSLAISLLKSPKSSPIPRPTNGDVDMITPKKMNTAEFETPSVKMRIENMLSVDHPHNHDLVVSPGLAKLRMTPGGNLKAKQKVLEEKHESTRQRFDELHVGGGVSIWPEMDNMRLSGREVLQLALLSCLLIFCVVSLFLKLHDTVLEKLSFFSTHLTQFMTRHPILLDDQSGFDKSTLYWHNDYRKLLHEMHRSFDVSSPSSSYQIYIFTYLLALAVLVHHLMENMFSANKLSPRRIKIWVSLLVTVATWSLMMMYLLVKARAVESDIENNVRRLSERLGDVLTTHLSPHTLQSVLLYWQSRCLPPMTTGTLTILGLLPVRDVSHYLQYYSVPVITVLVTPPARLIMSLYRLYVPTPTIKTKT